MCLLFHVAVGSSQLAFIAQTPRSGREVIRRAVAPHGSDTTIWRALSHLVDEGRLEGFRQGAPWRCSLEGAKSGSPGLLVDGQAMETGILATQSINQYQAVQNLPQNSTFIGTPILSIACLGTLI
jgi:hypothetical protein